MISPWKRPHLPQLRDSNLNQLSTSLTGFSNLIYLYHETKLAISDHSFPLGSVVTLAGLCPVICSLKITSSAGGKKKKKKINQQQANCVRFKSERDRNTFTSDGQAQIENRGNPGCYSLERWHGFLRGVSSLHGLSWLVFNLINTLLLSAICLIFLARGAQINTGWLTYSQLLEQFEVVWHCSLVLFGKMQQVPPARPAAVSCITAQTPLCDGVKAAAQNQVWLVEEKKNLYIFSLFSSVAVLSLTQDVMQQKCSSSSFANLLGTD